MTPAEVASRSLRGTEDPRRLGRLVDYADFRDAARRRLPRGVFDYVDGGADAEITLRRNHEAFEALEFRPRHGRWIAQPSIATTVLGMPLTMPVLTAPCGGMRLVHPHGDVGIAAAAAEAGVAHVATTTSGFTLEQLAEVPGPQLFQVYKVGSDELMRSLVERAARAGYHGLVATIDSAVSGHRTRDHHNGFSQNLRIDLRTVVRLAPRVATRPRWLLGFIRDGLPFTVPNTTLALPGGRPLDLPAITRTTRESLSPTWRDLEWMRATWHGPLVVKGILTVADAERARDLGADAIVVSNHGGRQLDGVPATLTALPRIAAAVGADLEVLLDSGLRGGADVTKALALGAKAVLLGRYPAYGLAAAGAPGVRRVLELVREGLVRTLQLLGCADLTDLGGVVAGSGWEN
ncbi:alpha-hydroxy acid oxidase [Amycolatopsis rhabdoformis]|uniref:Alpha-hydroxy acid oxidase n=1 Tax=Amycolatopsis rhabdoformis TaxID=1448059 RepID=A0ABZ1IEG6_9PSEU|nr:alpha-hydroxy acid oxidase [Amycolatopsis rhabdoformis]WSE32481.1 alpha-hydroxy acid oxidase [Amycolatopsis rhabdoformis]